MACHACRPNPRRRRRNPVDPLTTGMAAVSLAWNLAVSRELRDIRSKMRTNPSSALTRLNALERKLRSRKNPARSEAQRRLFGAALGVKRGSTPRGRVSKKIRRIAETMEEGKLREFARSAGRRRRNPAGLKGAKVDTSDPEFQAALKKFREFHGADPIEIVKVSDAPGGLPKYLVALGSAPEVTYLPRKELPKGSGPAFLHEWDDEPFLALSPDEKFLGYLGRGKGYKVRREGIHG